MNRLTTASSTGASYGGNYNYSYSYNALGNMLSRTENGTTTTYTYATSTAGYYNPDAAIHIGNATSTYDNNGNLTSDGTWAYTWDYRNQLTNASTTGKSITFAYDHTGQRVKQANGSTTRIYPTKYYNTDGTTPTKNIFLPDGTLIATVIGTGATTTVSYIHTDHLGGMNVATDDSGNVVELADYYPYGTSRLDEQDGLNSQRKFSNHELDSDTGLYYMNSRYQNPTEARFISQDPLFIAIGDNGQVRQLTGSQLQKILSDPQSLNSYIYARNNPLRMVDPNGEWFWDVMTGRQSWNSFVVEVGDAANYLYDNSGTWHTAMDHPIAAGATVGVAGGAAAYVGAAGLTYLSTEYLGGIGTGCILACNQIIQKAPEYAQQGYRSFEAFKNAVGSADPTGQNLRQWHHIVEQNASNVARFGQQAIQNGNNLVNIPTEYHQQVTAFYNSALSNGVRVRDFVNTLNFQFQSQIGQKVLDNVINGRAPGTGTGF